MLLIKAKHILGAQIFVKDSFQATTDDQGYYTIKHKYSEGMQSH